MDIQKYIDDLAEKALGAEPAINPGKSGEPMEPALKGKAIELWSTAAGRFFLVANEDDARQVIEQFGARRDEIYTAAEARRIIAVNDPDVVAEIHD